MVSSFNRNCLKFAMLTAVFATASIVHPASADSYVRTTAFEALSGTHAAATVTQPSEKLKSEYVRNTAFESYNVSEELSGTHASAKPATKGMAGQPGKMGEPGSAGTKPDTTQRSEVFDIKGDVPAACERYLRCSGY
jgi:hypothetical protein